MLCNSPFSNLASAIFEPAIFSFIRYRAILPPRSMSSARTDVPASLIFIWSSRTGDTYRPVEHWRV